MTPPDGSVPEHPVPQAPPDSGRVLPARARHARVVVHSDEQDGVAGDGQVSR